LLDFKFVSMIEIDPCLSSDYFFICRRKGLVTFMRMTPCWQKWLHADRIDAMLTEMTLSTNVNDIITGKWYHMMTEITTSIDENNVFPWKERFLQMNMTLIWFVTLMSNLSLLSQSLFYRFITFTRSFWFLPVLHFSNLINFISFAF